MFYFIFSPGIDTSCLSFFVRLLVRLARLPDGAGLTTNLCWIIVSCLAFSPHVRPSVIMQVPNKQSCGWRTPVEGLDGMVISWSVGRGWFEGFVRSLFRFPVNFEKITCYCANGEIRFVALEPETLPSPHLVTKVFRPATDEHKKKGVRPKRRTFGSRRRGALIIRRRRSWPGQETMTTVTHFPFNNSRR
jgi:hypothetical protein